jgi:hypothetical protein
MNAYNNNNYNSVALVRERTVLAELPPHVSEVSANFLRVEESVAWSAQQISYSCNLGFLDWMLGMLPKYLYKLLKRRDYF